MPAVNAGLLDGQLAWRQHDGVHTDGPRRKYFISWADKLTQHAAPRPPVLPADVPVARRDANSLVAHQQLLGKVKQGKIDLYFGGDSIVRRWGATDYPDLLANWKRNFFGWNAANFGWGGDQTQNILWRLNNGELDGIDPKVVVLLAGTNNVGKSMTPGGDDVKGADIARGVRAIVWLIEEKAPGSTIFVTGIFPRNDSIAVMSTIDKVNAELGTLADGKKIRYLNINAKLADGSGKLFDGIVNSDQLHPTVRTYQIWADALKPVLEEVLGAPAAEDHALPPTGDPGAH